MIGPERFDPAELAGTDDGHGGAFAAETGAVAREMEAFAAAHDVAPSPGFGDRVMAAVELVPAHGAPRGPLAGLVVMLTRSWRTALDGALPPAVRAQAAGLFLIVILGLSSLGALAAVGATRLLAPESTPPEAVPTLEAGPTNQPTIGPSVTPSLTPSLTPSPSPSPSPSESASADPTGSPGGGGSPTRTPKPSETPDPDDTPEPSETPDPEDTPKPSETPDPDDTPEPTDH